MTEKLTSRHYNTTTHHHHRPRLGQIAQGIRAYRLSYSTERPIGPPILFPISIPTIIKHPIGHPIVFAYKPAIIIYRIKSAYNAL